jgi:hypothetical protein
MITTAPLVEQMRPVQSLWASTSLWFFFKSRRLCVVVFLPHRGQRYLHFVVVQCAEPVARRNDAFALSLQSDVGSGVMRQLLC